VARRAAWLASFALLCSLLSGCFASPPQIIALDPPRGSLGVQADAPVEVQFDRAVVAASLIGRFSMSPQLPGCELANAFGPRSTGSCHIKWIDGDTAFVLEHTGAIFAPLTPYKFTVLGGFSDPSGAVNSVDHRWDLTTGSAPVVRGISPSDGARGVPIDSVITIAFSGGMATAATAGAVQLDPAVRGTRVVRSTLDASRFVVYPGRLLLPDTQYLVSIATTATDQHRQTLALPVVSTFRTGNLGTGGHGVVLAERIGEAPTSVLLTSLGAPEPGTPIAAAVAVEAPRCGDPAGCGAAALGAPLTTYRAAVLSPRGKWIAIVEDDSTVSGAPPSLVVLDVARRTVRTEVPGANLPSWSADGSTLAYAHGDAVALFDADTGTTRTLPAGDPLLSPAVWDQRGELLALDVGVDVGHSHVELADAVVGARYAIPGVAGSSTTPAISPDGSQLALLRQGGTRTGTWLIGIGPSSAPPRQLDESLSPVGYSSSGTLVAVSSGGSSAQLVQVSVESAGQVPIAHQPAVLSSVSVSPSVRRLAFLAPNSAGTLEAFAENADGTDPLALTALGPEGLEAAVVTLSG